MLFAALFACAGGTEETTPPPTEGTFSVLTYNVQGLPDALAEPTTPTADRMDQIAPMLDAYDVVGLQEDFDAANHDALVALATHPYQEWFDDLLDGSRLYGSGVDLLGRVGELVEVHEVHYAQCNGVLSDGSDCIASKGLLGLRVRVSTDAELDLFVTHMDAGGSEADIAARDAQIDQILDTMDSWSGDRAVLFMGDTNLRPSDPPDGVALERFAAYGLVDACTAVGCEEADHIDRFLFRPGAALSLEATSWARDASFVGPTGEDLSDHPAIGATFAWSVVE